MSTTTMMTITTTTTTMKQRIKGDASLFACRTCLKLGVWPETDFTFERRSLRWNSNENWFKYSETSAEMKNFEFVDQLFS